MIPALLKWVGSKRKFAEEIVSYMPTHMNTYYEPFLGSGAVLAEVLNQSRNGTHVLKEAIGSDILPFLIEIFEIVKSQPEILINYYQKEIEKYYLDPKNEYDYIRERFNQNQNALDFCLLSRTCYSGIIRFRKKDGFMSTPVGPHKPITPHAFRSRVMLWNDLLTRASFMNSDFITMMKKPQAGDVVYCDPPYTHSQSILYGAQTFSIDQLWNSIDECKKRGVRVLLSINGTRESKKKDISIEIPSNLFEREILIDCGYSMIDRLQNTGGQMSEEIVHDRLLLTY